MKESKYYRNKIAKKNINNSSWLTKLLLSIIIVLVSLIVCNFDSSIREKFTNEVLEKNINFGLYNKYYKKFMSKEEETVEVSNTLDDILDIEEVNGRYKIKQDIESPVVSLTPGIIVFNGLKEDLGNTIIIQGNDGVDIWYSGVTLNGFSIYDYISKGEIIGSCNGESILVSIVKDGDLLKYEEYFE